MLYEVITIKAVKVLSVAGAYWRGDEKRKQLTRVYGITFPKKKMLDEYLEMLEQAKQRDHRKLGVITSYSIHYTKLYEEFFINSITLRFYFNSIA